MVIRALGTAVDIKQEARAIGVDILVTVRHRQMRAPLIVYGGLGTLIGVYALITAPLLDAVVGVVVAIAVLPFVEFYLHRYVLHWLELAKWPPLAEVWRRVHYAHHMEPRDPDVILAQPISALFLITVLSGVYALLSPLSVVPLIATAFFLFASYEIVHFACHTDDKLQSTYFLKRRQVHAIHHYVDENKHFGITSSVSDALLGTEATDKKALARSPTVRNLGYTGAFAERYPYLRDTPPKE